MSRFVHFSRSLVLASLLVYLLALGTTVSKYVRQVHAQSDSPLATIEFDYPQQNSLFPPEITAPTFLWHDATAGVAEWKIEIDFANSAPSIVLTVAGMPPRVGPIDPRCVSPSNRPPAFAARLTSDHAWIPDEAMWASIKQNSKQHPATVRITGIATTGVPLSTGQLSISTSTDPVGAPIFYRDVPLIPSKSETGVIKPLAQSDLPLLAWRLRDISKPDSRLLLTGMHTCANCHSFSADGKTMGMDLDGPGNDKGLYFLADVRPQMSVTNRDVISWSAVRDKNAALGRIGFMSQVSPDGRYVITMLRGLKSELANSYFVVNFPDYRFLQVFYPTRGTLAWYDRATGTVHPLPGADDPRFVQTNPVWSPDGKTIVFARALARTPLNPGQKLPEHALAPEEAQIRFDLYSIPFNEGRGGAAEPIPGASNNGSSNSFPKISPDGRWIVYVQSRNGLLMRPDSKLFIIPFAGGEARALEANTPLMNSWHSFSPNGHWLVFSSKSRSPYTQMFLTHLDTDGHSSPAILIDNATAANRAVNIPEFVNIAANDLQHIEIPAAESYRLYDVATDLTARGKLEPAIAAWNQVLALDPDNAHAHLNLGVALQIKGDVLNGARHLDMARALDASINVTDSNLGVAFLNREEFENAIRARSCADILDYGKKLLEAAPNDREILQAISNCQAKTGQ